MYSRNIIPNVNIYSFQSQLARKGLRYLMWTWDVSVCQSGRGMEENCVGHLELYKPWTLISPWWWLQIINHMCWFAFISTGNQHNLPAAPLNSKPLHDLCKGQGHKEQGNQGSRDGGFNQILPMTLPKNISLSQTEQNSKSPTLRVKL